MFLQLPFIGALTNVAVIFAIELSINEASVRMKMLLTELESRPFSSFFSGGWGGTSIYSQNRFPDEQNLIQSDTGFPAYRAYKRTEGGRLF